jgi:hypothetical protein
MVGFKKKIATMKKIVQKKKHISMSIINFYVSFFSFCKIIVGFLPIAST